MTIPLKKIINPILFIIILSECHPENNDNSSVVKNDSLSSNSNIASNKTDTTSQSPKPEIDILPLITMGI
jgi:hypothetical protein